MILLIDHYDSFAHNLARYFVRLGQRVEVVRHDRLEGLDLRRARPSAVVLSPGPCGPRQAPQSLRLVRCLDPGTPLLGVCLGHQIMAAALGGEVARAPRPQHGQASRIEHDGRGIFAGVPCPLVAGRYHSLVVTERSLPAELEVSARSEDGCVMGIRHRERPWDGVQFHPESILTEFGYMVLRNFLVQNGLAVEADAEPLQAAELRRPREAAARLRETPVTF